MLYITFLVEKSSSTRPESLVFFFQVGNIIDINYILVIPPPPQPLSNIHERTVMLLLDAAVLVG